MYTCLLCIAILVLLQVYRPLDRKHESAATVVIYTPLLPSATGLPSGDCEIGDIVMSAGPRENIPEGWAPCDGRQMPTSEYPELANVLLGASEGRAPQVLMSLPDLRGISLRTPIGKSARIGWGRIRLAVPSERSQDSASRVEFLVKVHDAPTEDGGNTTRRHEAQGDQSRK
ncbi:MAG: tail fiber protein [Planctomycetes bacterium]|nr:tail fiber protein [Planctomycetota bacterium]